MKNLFSDKAILYTSMPTVSLFAPMLKTYIIDSTIAKESPWYIPTCIGVSAAVILPYIYGTSWPLDLSKKRWEGLDEGFLKIFKKYSDEDIHVNYMEPARRLPCKIEPVRPGEVKTKLQWFPEIFDVKWSDDGDIVHRNLIFTTNQGTSGVAYRNGTRRHSYVGGLMNPKKLLYDYNLSYSQYIVCKNLKLLMSYPIYKISIKGHKKVSEIVGVLNISSSSINSKIMFKNKVKREKFERDIKTFIDKYVQKTIV